MQTARHNSLLNSTQFQNLRIPDSGERVSEADKFVLNLSDFGARKSSDECWLDLLFAGNYSNIVLLLRWNIK